MKNNQLQQQLEAVLATLKQHPDDWEVTLMDASSTMFELVDVSVHVKNEDIRFCTEGKFCQ